MARDLASVYMGVSAFTVLLSAVVIVVAPQHWLPHMQMLVNAGVTLSEVEKLSPLLAMFMLSSGAGKLTALYAGAEAIQRFCRLNLVATSMLVFTCWRYDDVQGLVTWSAFALAYAYFGFWDRARDAYVVKVE